jgi:signal transduction histidine kinase
LLALTGIGWFVGNLDSMLANAVPIPVFGGALASALLASHRAFFAHAVMSYPTGRLATPLERLAVGSAYASVIVGSIWRFGPPALLLSALFVGVAFVTYRKSVGQRRRAKLVAVQAAFIVAAATVTGVVLRSSMQLGLAAEPATLLYELALSASVVFLTVGLFRPRTEDAAVVDFVIDLGETRSGTLRDALADVLGDPSLEVAYRVRTDAAYVDGAGRPFELPRPSFERAITRIARDGREVAVLVHDPAVLADPALVDAVASAAHLASRNAELQAEVRNQLVELRASRRRIIGAGDSERRRLERRLTEGALRRLDELDGTLRSARERQDPSLDSGQLLERASLQLTQTMVDLRELGRGLHPLALREGGLLAGLQELTERSPWPVRLAFDGGRFPAEVEAAIYFLCAEGLANAAKHARAAHVQVAVQSGSDRVEVHLADDGVGGADLTGGTGLRGLTDRIEALGGWVTLDSPTGGGTRLTAQIPLSDEG